MTLTSCAASSARQICVPMMQRAPDVEAPLAVDELAELDPLEVLHHEEERAVGRGPRVGDVDDVRVRDLRGGARLAPQPLDQVGRLAVRGVQNLQRDAPADVDVLGLVDAAHAALAAQPPHVVAAADDGPEHGGRAAAVLRLASATRSGSFVGVAGGRPRFALLGSRKPEARLAHGELPVARVVRSATAAGSDCSDGAGLCAATVAFCDGSGGGPAPGGRRPRARVRSAAADDGVLRRVPLARLDDQRLALGALAAMSSAYSSRRNVASARRVRRRRRLREERRQIVAQLLAASRSGPSSSGASAFSAMRSSSGGTRDARRDGGTSSGLRTRRRSSSDVWPSLGAPGALPDGNSCRPVSSSHSMIPGGVQIGAPVELLARAPARATCS